MQVEPTHESTFRETGNNRTFLAEARARVLARDAAKPVWEALKWSIQV
jgi:hypothetical protein